MVGAASEGVVMEILVALVKVRVEYIEIHQILGMYLQNVYSNGHHSRNPKQSNPFFLTRRHQKLDQGHISRDHVDNRSVRWRGNCVLKVALRQWY